mmetsp:Transcript_25677/g.50261  ORF Transcript_25677/g.50261 Transcript_25677/m.50261 type:complete len:100 (+) Transcript_25677:271-570(+)
MVALPKTLSAEENRTPFASGHVPELGTVVGLTSGGVPRDQDSTFGFLAFQDLARSRQASSEVLSHTGLLSGKLDPALPLPSGQSGSPAAPVPLYSTSGE